MGQSVVLDEAEISKALNQINNYADFLARTVEEYMNLLYEVPGEKAITDVLICAELIEMIQKVFMVPIRVRNTCEDAVKTIKKMIPEVETADNFTYPGEVMASISALLAKLM